MVNQGGGLRPSDEEGSAMGAAVMRTMPNIAREWGVADVEMATLLGLEAGTYRAWSNDPTRAILTLEQRERASYLLGIYKSLIMLLPLPDL